MDLPNTDLIQHDWDSDKKPEIYQSVTHSCIEGQLVSKNAFATAANTTFLDGILSMCQISGWMNETIGKYTCTKGCRTPTNYSEVFTMDFEEGSGDEEEGSGDEEEVVIPIGTKVKYVIK